MRMISLGAVVLCLCLCLWICSNTNAVISTADGYYVNISCDMYDKLNKEMVSKLEFIQVDCSDLR